MTSLPSCCQVSAPPALRLPNTPEYSVGSISLSLQRVAAAAAGGSSSSEASQAGS